MSASQKLGILSRLTRPTQLTKQSINNYSTNVRWMLYVLYDIACRRENFNI